MNKIDRNKRICALFLSASLSLPLMGCMKEEYENDVYYNGTTIIDNSGARLYLTKEMNEEIMGCDDEFITIPFGDNKLTFETSELKKDLAREKQEKITSDLALGFVFFGCLGCMVSVIARNYYSSNKSKTKGKKK